jgi:CRP-like cAMP-binding protein
LQRPKALDNFLALVLRTKAMADHSETLSPGGQTIEKTAPRKSAGPEAQRQKVQRDNLLLGSLPGEERERLRPFLQLVELSQGESLIEPNQPMTNVYFPIDMVSSTLQELSDGSSIEAGLMGAEGMIGIQLWLMQRTTPSRTITQVPGMAYRMASAVFRREVMEKQSPLNPLIASYVHAFLFMTSQTAACNRLHEVETRLARWLLLIYDRVLEDDFPLRQDFLASMLGVHRPSVTIAANTLQRAGAISYTRGHIHIDDPVALRQSACECYQIIESVFDGMFGPEWRQRS